MLMTKELEKKLEKYPIGSQDGKGMDAEVLVKYFNPCGAGTWLITEGEKQEKWRLVILRLLQHFRMGVGLCHAF